MACIGKDKVYLRLTNPVMIKDVGEGNGLWFNRCDASGMRKSKKKKQPKQPYGFVHVETKGNWLELLGFACEDNGSPKNEEAA